MTNPGSGKPHPWTSDLKRPSQLERHSLFERDVKSAGIMTPK